MSTEIRFFALSKKKKVLDRGQNGFYREDNSNNKNKTTVGFSPTSYC